MSLVNLDIVCSAEAREHSLNVGGSITVWSVYSLTGFYRLGNMLQFVSSNGLWLWLSWHSGCF